MIYNLLKQQEVVRLVDLKILIREWEKIDIRMPELKGILIESGKCHNSSVVKWANVGDASSK